MYFSVCAGSIALLLANIAFTQYFNNEKKHLLEILICEAKFFVPLAIVVLFFSGRRFCSSRLRWILRGPFVTGLCFAGAFLYAYMYNAPMAVVTALNLWLYYLTALLAIQLYDYRNASNIYWDHLATNNRLSSEDTLSFFLSFLKFVAVSVVIVAINAGNITVAWLNLTLTGYLIENRTEYLTIIIVTAAALTVLLAFFRIIISKTESVYRCIFQEFVFVLVWMTVGTALAHLTQKECLPLCFFTVWCVYYVGLNAGRGPAAVKDSVERPVSGIYTLLVPAILLSINTFVFYTYSGAGKMRYSREVSAMTLREFELSGVNAMGFRGPPLSAEKAADEIRIMCVGDSATYGWMVGADRTYSHRLHNMLNRAAGTRRFTVINYGTLGHNSRVSRLRLAKDLEAMDPDLLTVMLGINGDQADPEDYYYNVQVIIEMCRSGNIQVLLMTYPNRDRDKVRNINSMIRELAEEENIPMLDMDGYLYENGLFFTGYYDNAHPNNLGHQLIAEKLFSYLVAHYGTDAERWQGFSHQK